MEYRRKCKVCGHIWCYTDQDLKENQTNSAMTAVSAIGQIASAFGGNIFQQAYLNNQTDKLKNKIVDYNKCPQCNSLSTELISDEEWKQLNKKKSQGTAVQQIKTIQISSNATPESLINRATVFLEDLEWEKADAYAEACLDMEPQNASAYLIKLLAELQVPTKEKLSKCKSSFEDNALYKKVLRYGESELVSELKNYINIINERNQKAQQREIYNQAIKLMNSASMEKEYKEAEKLFAKIPEYSNAEVLKNECSEKAEVCRKETIYLTATNLTAQETIESYEAALIKYKSIINWKDSESKIDFCEHKITQLKQEEEITRINSEKKRKRNKRIASIVVPALLVVVITIICCMPAIKYTIACSKINSEDFITAYDLLSKNNYKDSSTKATEIKAKAYAQKISNSSEGDIVTYGNYKGSDINWFIIEKSGNKALLLSEKVLDKKPYHDKVETTTWENCYIRTWLNESFISEAFSASEVDYIINSSLNHPNSLKYGTSGGNATNDKIFLLSILEAQDYLTYATRNVDEYWWLRSPVSYSSFTSSGKLYESWYGAVVTHEGEIKEGITGGDIKWTKSEGSGVRPAIWVEYK